MTPGAGARGVAFSSGAGLRSMGFSPGAAASNSQAVLAQRQQERANHARAYRAAGDQAREAGNTALAVTNYMRAANAAPQSADGQAARAALDAYRTDAASKLRDAKDLLADRDFERASALLQQQHRDYAALPIGQEIEQALRRLERTKSSSSATAPRLEARPNR